MVLQNTRPQDVGNDVVFLSDMDGTLTPPRLPMKNEFALAFKKLVKGKNFYIVTGSDLVKIEEQIPASVMDEISGIYASMGNELYLGKKLIYRNEFTPEKALLDKLVYYRNVTRYPNKLYSNFIEKRCGMINFCVPGRDCPLEARDMYREWDNLHGERKMLAAALSAEFPNCDFSIGGSISIDIVPAGFGKIQVAAHIRNLHPNKKVVFFGDKTEKGGNDYDIAQKLIDLGNAEIVPIESPVDVLRFLS
ncbi:MAG: HAD-IIB family hydrolase [Holosporales bacterium]|jgi:phosphomannomutase|nr:HAD-IIB family hydrolase [Holosporales bacterium]